MGPENDHRQLVGKDVAIRNWLEIFKTVNGTHSRQIRKKLMAKTFLPCYSQTLTIICSPNH
jgi:hypothetical protein